ncbi:hypothetical protein [Sinorhizobium meliloti]|uniref:hypothetical protein n=1 Tax=Rhizobium meliloti TaxID=382 RepID=UPI001F2934EA|nr:hypothetical protein [Sinorhizobium meliloti]
MTHGWLSPDVELSCQVHAISPRFCFSGGIGNKDRAVELLELALKSLDGHGAKEVFQPDLLQTLANYKREEVVTAMFSWFRGRMFQAVPRRRLSRRTRLKEALLNDFSLRGALIASSR